MCVCACVCVCAYVCMCSLLNSLEKGQIKMRTGAGQWSFSFSLSLSVTLFYICSNGEVVCVYVCTLALSLPPCCESLLLLLKCLADCPSLAEQLLFSPSLLFLPLHFLQLTPSFISPSPHPTALSLSLSFSPFLPLIFSSPVHVLSLLVTLLFATFVEQIQRFKDYTKSLCCYRWNKTLHSSAGLLS